MGWYFLSTLKSPGPISYCCNPACCTPLFLEASIEVQNQKKNHIYSHPKKQSDSDKFQVVPMRIQRGLAWSGEVSFFWISLRPWMLWFQNITKISVISYGLILRLKKQSFWRWDSTASHLATEGEESSCWVRMKKLTNVNLIVYKGDWIRAGSLTEMEKGYGQSICQVQESCQGGVGEKAPWRGRDWGRDCDRLTNAVSLKWSTLNKHHLLDHQHILTDQQFATWWKYICW